MCKITEVGTRSLSFDEYRFLKKSASRIKAFDMNTLIKNPDSIKKIVASLSKNIYITLDLDVLDPSIMPAVGTPEPGGMMWYQLLTMLKSVAKKRNVVGFDVVELMPIKGNAAPSFLAAKLIYRLLGYIFNPGR